MPTPAVAQCNAARGESGRTCLVTGDGAHQLTDNELAEVIDRGCTTRAQRA